MRIYLDGGLLTQSRVFKHPVSESYIRNYIIPDYIERQWTLFTWGSKNRLTAEKDGTSRKNSDTIEVLLGKLNKEWVNAKEFLDNNFGLPDHVILISGEESSIRTPYSTMKKMIKNLERRGIFCLLSPCRAPVFDNAAYISKKIKKEIGKPSYVEL